MTHQKCRQGILTAMSFILLVKDILGASGIKVGENYRGQANLLFFYKPTLIWAFSIVLYFFVDSILCLAVISALLKKSLKSFILAADICCWVWTLFLLHLIIVSTYFYSDPAYADYLLVDITMLIVYSVMFTLIFSFRKELDPHLPLVQQFTVTPTETQSLTNVDCASDAQVDLPPPYSRTLLSA